MLIQRCDINPTTNTLACSSDERLKKNITPMGDDLSQIMALQPVYFNWNAETSGTAAHPGFIAQQLQQVMPEVVSTDPTTGLLSIGYSDLVPAVVSAMQQMQAEITTLQGGLSGNVSSSNLTVYSPSNFSGDSVGEAKILAGQSSVRVSFSQPYEYEPIVTLTPENQTATGEFVTDRDASGFTILAPAPVTSDTTFAWHSLSSPAEQLTVSAGSTAPVVLIVPAAAAAAEVQSAGISPDDINSASSTPDSGASSTPTTDSVSSTPSVLGTSSSTPSGQQTPTPLPTPSSLVSSDASSDSQSATTTPAAGVSQ